jgi:chromosome segregation ATPase
MKYNLTNYHEFLLDLWKITKDNGGFKAFSALISKHGVSKSMSVVLCDDLEWVSDNGTLYIWQLNKPTKKDAECAYMALKVRLDLQKQKKSAVKTTDKPVNVKKIVYKSKSTKDMVESLAELSKDLSNIGNNDIAIGIATKQYTDTELNSDVKNILAQTAEEVAISKQLYELHGEYNKTVLLMETERKISSDAIQSLTESNTAMEAQINNLTTINSDLRNNLITVESRLEVLDTTKSQLENRLNSLHTKMEEKNVEYAVLEKQHVETTKELDTANAYIKSTLKYKINSWFRK